MSKYSILSLLGVVAVSLTSVMPQAHAFEDVYDVTPYSEAIAHLKSEGVIEGYDDGTFKPGRTLNRAEFLKIILESREGTEIDGQNCFPDVSDEWFAPYVCTAKEEGIIEGYPDGTFRPDQEINFVEASKILSLAFGQDIDESGADWYEQYVRALENSNAIPLSFERLEQLVKRGEMAEMMWRLTEEKTGQPSKGYLNVKYPELMVNTSSDEPQKAQSCTDLKAFVAEAQRGGGNIMFDDMVAPPMMMRAQDGDMAETAASPASNDFSDTNVQVVGVDEADIIKNDGTYVYAIQDNALHITKAFPASEMEWVSTIDFSDGDFSPSEMYVDGNRLVVIGSSWRMYSDSGGARTASIMPIWQGGNKTVVRVYDIADRSNPTLARTVSFDGHQLSSRRINDRVFLVMNQSVRWFGPGPVPVPLESDLLPTFSDSARGSGEEPVTRCGNVTILPREPQPQYLIVATIPISDVDAEVGREVVLGNATNVYSSKENMYIASNRWRYVWRDSEGGGTQNTVIYRFAIEDDGIAMRAKGQVPGTVLNQFSMDEHDDHFRIATTAGNMWSTDNPSANNLYVLNQNLERTGQIEDIAPGERIYSVRFMGDRTYMVTFKKVDPFFVIDTSDPRNPTILGKLKIPGYSDYLHPYDDDHIIGFGKEAVEAKEGDFAWYQGMKIALFNVEDPSDPVELHKLTIGDRGTDSPLLQNHKALLFEKDRNLLAFPIQIHKLDEEQKVGEEGSAWGEPVFQGAHVYTLTLNDGFVLRGSITHYDEDDYLKAGGYLHGKSIQRITRIEDDLLTVSQVGIQSHDAEGIEKQGEVSFVEEEAADCPTDEEATYISKDVLRCQVIDFFCEDGKEAFSNACGCGCLE